MFPRTICTETISSIILVRYWFPTGRAGRIRLIVHSSSSQLSSAVWLIISFSNNDHSSIVIMVSFGIEIVSGPHVTVNNSSSYSCISCLVLFSFYLIASSSKLSIYRSMLASKDTSCVS